ncbi:MAG: hypothetical protein KDD53_01345, partial [Bdellovibrionales bacterium]|nr:hypothetical protein [Bdellovibrionales bacterium]
MLPQVYAQSIQCSTETYSFPVQTNTKFGITEYIELPALDLSEKLVGISGSVAGECYSTLGAENSSSSNPVTVTPYESCKVRVHIGSFLGLNTFVLLDEDPGKQYGQTASLSTYDGTFDGLGTSGSTQEVHAPLSDQATQGSLPYTYTAIAHDGDLQAFFFLTRNQGWDPPFTVGFLPTTNAGADFNLTLTYMIETSAPGSDCDGDGTSDSCEITSGGDPDLDGDGWPDSCGPAPDCNGNGISDVNEIAAGAPDCNLNFTPDSCDITANPSLDLNQNGQIDSCEPPPDCDGNGISDEDEIAAGAWDCNSNGIPDSCDIASDPALDNQSGFASDGIIDICQGLVRWEKPVNPVLGIQGAVIESYWISGTETDPDFHTISSATTYFSDNSGKFLVPKEYFGYPQQAGEIGRGIKASVTYTDNTGVQTERTIVNYPGWDPLQPVRSGQFDRKIYFPSPVVFQPGVLAQVNNGSVNILRPFLTLDAADSSVSPDWAAIKRGDGSASQKPLPAFLFFAMPSAPNEFPWMDLPSDNVSWGYNNNPLTATDQQVAGNAISLELFLSQKVKQELYWLSGPNSVLIPYNMTAHSYGGVITRKWMTNKYPQEYVNRYVSFDGVHGGTYTPAGSWFGESKINGTSLTSNTPPSSLGWNYSHDVGTDFSRFLISASDNKIINPYTSALGIGRTMGLYGSITNGHCSRFIGGWELPGAFGSTHSIHTKLPVVVSAARFLAYGTAPYIGDEDDPSGLSKNAWPSLSASDSGYDVGCNVSSDTGTAIPLGTASLQISVPVSGQTNIPFPVDSQSGTLHIEAFVSSSSATLNLYNGTSLQPKLNQVITPYNDSDYFESFDIAIAGTVNKTLRLTSSEPAHALLNITFANKRFLDGGTDAQSYSAGTAVKIKAQMRNQDGLIINPTTGMIDAIVTHPDGTETLVTLYDDGLHGDGNPSNGIFANTFTDTSIPGFYQVHYDANYTWVGWPIHRTSESSFEILSTAANLDPNMSQHVVDSNGDGNIDSWAVDLTIVANQAGNFRVVGDLVGPAGEIMLLDNVVTLNAASTTTVPLVVPLNILATLSSNSTYTLENIKLIEISEGQVLGENASITLTLPSAGLDPLPLPQV